MNGHQTNRYKGFGGARTVSKAPTSPPQLSQRDYSGGSETDVSTSTENLSNEERYVIRHTERQEPQGQEHLPSTTPCTPSNRSSLDVSTSSYNTLIIHNADDEGKRTSHHFDRNITDIPDDYLNQSQVLKHLAKEVRTKEVKEGGGSLLRSKALRRDKMHLSRSHPDLRQVGLNRTKGRHGRLEASEHWVELVDHLSQENARLKVELEIYFQKLAKAQKKKGASFCALLASLSTQPVQLPVTFRNGCSAASLLVISDPAWQKQYIHLHLALEDSLQPSFMYIDQAAPIVDIPLAGTLSTSSVASGFTPSSVSEACSYTLIKDPGYTIMLKRNGDSWQAMVYDKTFPGLSRSFAATVTFEKGYQLEDFIIRDSSWQSRHIHIIVDKGRPMVYIGSFGLKGGSLLNLFGYESCTFPLCFSDVWHCVCGYKCEADMCWLHCTTHYQTHVCTGCRTVARCPKHYKCQACESKTHCSKCCGCYERQMQMKMQMQEQIRQQQRKERQAILSKVDNILASASIAQENIAHVVQSTSSAVAVIGDQTNQEDTYEFVYQGSSVQNLNYQAAYADHTIDSDRPTDSPSLTRSNSSDSIFSVDSADSDRKNDTDQESELLDTNPNGSGRKNLLQSIVSNISNLNSGISNAFFSLAKFHNAADDSSDDSSEKAIPSSFTGQNTDDQSADLPTTAIDVPEIVDISLIKSLSSIFLENYTAHLSPEEKTHFDQTVGTFVKEKLPQVDAALQQSIIDYFTNETPLYPYIVQHYPVSEWIKQSLLKEVVSYANENDYFLNSFRTQWLHITEQYSVPNQVSLLKALKSKKYIHNLSLLDISNILDLVFHTGSSGYDIVCGTEDDWLSSLKIMWLQSQLQEYLPSSLASDCDRLKSELAGMDWSIDMMKQFLKSIQHATILDPILLFLSTIKNYQIPDTLVLSTNMHDLLDVEHNKVQQWTNTIIDQLLLYKIDQLSSKFLKYIGPSLSKILEQSCSVKLLGLIDEHTYDFKKVLELLYDYKVTEEICASAFTLLSQEAAADWINKVDKLISCKLFQDIEVYTTDKLIARITAESSAFTSEELKASYDAVITSYNSTSTVLNGINDPKINCFKNKPIVKWDKKAVSLWSKKVISSTPSNYSIFKSELIAGVMQSAKLHYGFRPRNTQILSLLTLLNPAEGMGRLVQINTGEGKSLIVAMLAAIHALQGKKVDVITTSTELSIPEVKDQKRFFEYLSLTVAENSDVLTKQSAYKSDVVYGTAGDFQADILRTEFLGQDIRGERGFNIVIVDEVDSMLFDNRSHSVRLSEQTPGMTHLELPLAAIWEHMQRTVSHMTTIEDKTYFIAEDFKRNGKDIILYSNQEWESCAVTVKDKRSFIMEQTQQHLEQLLRELNDEEKCEYFAYKELNKSITALEETIAHTTNAKKKEKNIECCKLESDKLKDLPWCQRYPVLDVPVHLRDFARSQIPYWIRSALNAAYGYKKGAHYTVQDDRIVPVHFNETGVLQSNMVWSDGLTQFLQLKEGLRIDPEGVATNFISNISFFKRYRHHIYGLTGTLGEKPTKDFLSQMYHTDTVVIPPYQHRNIIGSSGSRYVCKELIPIVLSNIKDWFQAAIDHTLSHAQHQRAVLIICKYIRQVEEFYDKLCEQYDSKKIFTYTGEETFEKREIDSGEIIIATNIAGRGKDLQTTLSVESHGGLYVAVTFLPESYRVEIQNVGRTARSGKKGMAQLIIYDPESRDIEGIKKFRNEQEVLASEKAIQDARKMLLQDCLFQRFSILENQLLPTARTCSRAQKWEDLLMAWEEHAAEVLSPSKIAEYVNRKILNRKNELKKECLRPLSKDEKSKLTEYDNETILNRIAFKAESERYYFEEQYKKQILNAFCNAQSHLPEELITCLKEGRVFKPNLPDLAKKYAWDMYDRKGFEEVWGFWLKGEHFEEKELSIENAMDRFQNAFDKLAKDWALEDKLIRNPYFYVLKGNEYLIRGNLSQAISYYDRAIEMDPDFSVNALYNKAQALLSYEKNEGDLQSRAYEALKKAKEIIGTISRPALLTFSALIAQHGSKIQTSEHVQHQMNLLSQQENYIDRACAVIKEAQSNGYHVKLTTHLISEKLNSADQDHSQAIREAAVNGFTHLFTIDKVEPVPWKSIIGLALISLAQITAGCLITACTGGALGVGLIFEGVSDMITTVKSTIQGSFDWGAWALQKAISLAVSLISSGFQSVTNSLRAVANTTKDLVGKAAVGATRAGISLAKRELATALAKGVVKECLTAVGQWSVDKLFMEDLEKKITEQVEIYIAEALSKNQLIVRALELDVENGNNNWQNLFIEEGLSILQQQKEHVCLTALREISLGVAKNKIPYGKQFFEVAGVCEMLTKLTNYTKEFVGEFNSKVEHYKSEIESVQQKVSTNVSSTVACEEVVSSAPNIDLEETDIVTDTERGSTVYSSKSMRSSNGSAKGVKKFYKGGGPSNRKSIVDTFKVQIGNKLTNVVRSNLVNPAVNYGVNWSTSCMFREVCETTNNLRDQVRTARDRRYYSNKLAHASEKERKKKEKENKQKNNGTEVNSSKEKSNKTKLNESAQKGVKKLKRDAPLDANDLAAIAAFANAPIRVYDKKTGKLVDIVGDKLPGKPITLLHAPSNGSNPGHWEPLDGNIHVESSGPNNCLVDAVFAQLNQDNKNALHNANGLKEKMIEVIHNNPKEANEAYEKRDKLASIAPDELRIGGRLARKEEKEIIDNILPDLKPLFGNIEFEQMTINKGGCFQFLSQEEGSAENAFKNLITKLGIEEEIVQCDKRNGTLYFTHENTTYSLRADSRKIGKTTISILGYKNIKQQILIRF